MPHCIVGNQQRPTLTHRRFRHKGYLEGLAYMRTSTVKHHTPHNQH